MVAKERVKTEISEMILCTNLGSCQEVDDDDLSKKGLV